MRKKSIYLIGAFLILLSALMSLSAPFANTTYAKSSKEMVPAEQAQSYSYYYGLQTCLRSFLGQRGGVNTSNLSQANRTKNISDGNWFISSTQIPPRTAASYLSPGVDMQGRTECNTIVKAATKLWGYKDSKELFCSFSSSGVCDTNGVGFNDPLLSSTLTQIQANNEADGLRRAVANKVYARETPTSSNSGLDAKHYYLYYFRAFTIGCNAKEDINASGANSYTVKLVSEDGTSSERKFSGSRHTDKKYVYQDNTGEVQRSCQDIAQSVSDYAPGFVQFAQSNPGVIPANEDEKNPPTTTCVVDGIGWILCPTLNALSGMADASYAFLANGFLEIDRDILNTDPTRTVNKERIGTSAYDAWKAMQSIANIAFVIAFIVIIYSQLTGTGIGNYGVKRLLPRIVIAAILVNTSFILCQIAVDISNILGYGLKNMFDAVNISSVHDANSIAISDRFSFASLTGSFLSGTALIGAAAVGVYLAIPFIGGAILATLVALIGIGFILIARKALIVLFVVISPLAFVAYLLPNTEGLFKKWFSIFKILLLLFPIIGVLFGAGTLASRILINVAGDDPILQLVGLTAAAIPLFAVIPILKGSLDGIGNIGAKINGITNKAEGSARAKGREAFNNSRFGQARAFRKQRRARTRELAQMGINESGTRAGGVYAGAHQLLNKNRLSGAYGDSLAKKGEAMQYELRDEAFQKSVNALNMAGLNASELQSLALGNDVKGLKASDEPIRQAAIRSAMSQNGIAANEQLIIASGNMSASLRKEVAHGVTSNNLASKANYLGGDIVDKINSGEIKSQADLEVAAAQRVSAGKLSAQGLVSQDATALERFSKVANNTQQGIFTTTVPETGEQKSVSIDKGNLETLQNQSFDIRNKDHLNAGVTAEQMKHIENIGASRDRAEDPSTNQQ